MQRFRLPLGHLFVHFIEPAARTTEHLANEGFRLSRPLDRPLRDVLQQVVTFKLAPRLDRQICQFSKSCFKDSGHRLSTVGSAGRNILNRPIDFMIVHEQNPNRDFHILSYDCQTDGRRSSATAHISCAPAYDGW